MYQRDRRKLILPFLLPQSLLYAVFTLVPLALTVYYSFTNWYGLTMDFDFYGTANLETVIKDPFFLNAVRNSFVFVFIGGILMLIPAMLVTLALHEPIRAKSFFRFVILLPTVLAGSVVGLMWKWMYNPSFGLINPVLRAIGLGEYALAWLGNEKTALVAIIIAMVWYKIGLWVLLLTAGLEKIPPEILEAGKIDGAGDRQLFFRITLPLMWETIRVVLILWIVWGLQEFTIIFALTGPTIFTLGGPLGATELMTIYVFKTAFGAKKWAYAMAIATVMLAMILALCAVSNRLTRKEVVEL
ncbi:MAG: sugar ABC transporter permease [Anaerolineae bacterium]|nr:sugar ABC transporter permease [Anaerolineae bacterium]